LHRYPISAAGKAYLILADFTFLATFQMVLATDLIADKAHGAFRSKGLNHAAKRRR